MVEKRHAKPPEDAPEPSQVEERIRLTQYWGRKVAEYEYGGELRINDFLESASRFVGCALECPGVRRRFALIVDSAYVEFSDARLGEVARERLTAAREIFGGLKALDDSFPGFLEKAWAQAGNNCWTVEAAPTGGDWPETLAATVKTEHLWLCSECAIFAGVNWGALVTADPLDGVDPWQWACGLGLPGREEDSQRVETFSERDRYEMDGLLDLVRGARWAGRTFDPSAWGAIKTAAEPLLRGKRRIEDYRARLSKASAENERTGANWIVCLALAHLDMDETAAPIGAITCSLALRTVKELWNPNLRESDDFLELDADHILRRRASCCSGDLTEADAKHILGCLVKRLQEAAGFALEMLPAWVGNGKPRKEGAAEAKNAGGDPKAGQDEMMLAEISKEYEVPISALSKAWRKPEDDINRLPARKLGTNVYAKKADAEKWCRNYRARADNRALYRGASEPEKPQLKDLTRQATHKGRIRKQS